MKSTVEPTSRGRFQMNCCLVCNKPFYMEKTSAAGAEDEKLKVVNLCKILQVPFIEEQYEPEVNPLCCSCAIVTKDYLTIQKKIQNLIFTLGKLKKTLAKKMVVSYKQALPNRKNLRMRKCIYDAWISRFTDSHETEGTQCIEKPGEPVIVNLSSGLTTTLTPEIEAVPCSSPIGSPYQDDDYGNDSQNDIGQAPHGSLQSNHDTGAVSPPAISSCYGNQSSQTQVSTVQVGRQQHCCRTCGKIFPSNFSLQMHERLHTGERPFACSQCAMTFNAKCNRDKHEKTHDSSRRQGEPNFVCNLCGKKYHLEASLRCHKRRHALGKVRLPSEKPKSTINPKNIQEKKKENEDKKRSPKAKADECSEIIAGAPQDHDDVPEMDQGVGVPDATKEPKFKLQRRLIMKAMTSAIKVEVKREDRPKKNKTCADCGKIFRTAYELKIHMPTHTGEKPFQCDVCLRDFMRPESKIKHMATHRENRFQGEKTHICDMCGKEFYLRHSLYNHRRRVHLGISRYKAANTEYGPTKCQVCDKTFSAPHKLKEHMIRHTERKKFPCSICQKPFFTSSEAKDHAKNYHDPEKLQRLLFKHKCPACPPEYIGFSRKDAVRQHWTEVHSDKRTPEEYRCLKSAKRPSASPWECKDCPEGMRPIYKHKESLQKHCNKFHADGTGRGGKRKRPFQLTRRNAVALQKKVGVKRDEESMDSTSCSDGDSDLSKELPLTRSSRIQIRIVKVETEFSDLTSKELRIVLQKVEEDEVACEQYCVLKEFKKNL